MKNKLKRSKPICAALAAVCCAALLLTGTFAWQRVISKTNEFIGDTGGTVHDDFDPETGMKDVYVENTSSRTLFVRVKLAEAMSLSDSGWRPASSDWQAHTYDPAAEDCGHANAAGDKLHDYFRWTMGGQKYYKPATGSEPVVQDKTQYAQGDSGVKLTPDAQIVSASQYGGLGDGEKAAFTGWVVDAGADGYAYWSQPLGSGGVTGLLLNGVASDHKLDDCNYYYAIDVIAEIVDPADLPMWESGAPPSVPGRDKLPEASAEAKAVLGYLRSAAAQP
jgi:hypothetical protein